MATTSVLSGIQELAWGGSDLRYWLLFLAYAAKAPIDLSELNDTYSIGKSVAPFIC
jgi:hypothetical protein